MSEPKNLELWEVKWHLNNENSLIFEDTDIQYELCEYLRTDDGERKFEKFKQTGFKKFSFLEMIATPVLKEMWRVCSILLDNQTKTNNVQWENIQQSTL